MDELDCFRAESRYVSRIIENEILPLVEEEGLELSADCPLVPTSFLYYEQEQHKSQKRGTDWACSYCGKVFRTEFYLDRHMDNKHADKIPPTALSCAADLCDIFDCPSSRVEGTTIRAGWNCDSSKMDHAKHKCKKLFHKCLPPEKGSNSKKTHDRFLYKYCDPLECDFAGSPQDLSAIAAVSDDGSWQYFGYVGMFVSVFLYWGALFYNNRRVFTAPDMRRPSWWQRFFGPKNRSL